MFIFDFRYDRKLGSRQEVGSPNLHGYSQILVIEIKLTFRHDMSLSIPTSENMAAVTVSIFAAAAITGKKKRVEDCF